jgi:hypothetical protein
MCERKDKKGFHWERMIVGLSKDTKIVDILEGILMDSSHFILENPLWYRRLRIRKALVNYHATIGYQ